MRFLVLGKSRDPSYERGLRRCYGDRPNIEFLGMVDQFASDGHGRALGESWIWRRLPMAAPS